MAPSATSAAATAIVLIRIWFSSFARGRRSGRRLLSLRPAGAAIATGDGSQPTAVLSQRKDVEHCGVTLILELGRVDEPGLARGRRPGCDRKVLLAADLEGHRRCGEARADIDLPEFVERGVVEGGNGAVHEREEDKPAAGRERPAVVRVTKMDVLLDLAGHRVDGGQVAFIAVGDLEGAAVPACRFAVPR